MRRNQLTKLIAVYFIPSLPPPPRHRVFSSLTAERITGNSLGKRGGGRGMRERLPNLETERLSIESIFRLLEDENIRGEQIGHVIIADLSIPVESAQIAAGDSGSRHLKLLLIATSEAGAVAVAVLSNLPPDPYELNVPPTPRIPDFWPTRTTSEYWIDVSNFPPYKHSAASRKKNLNKTRS